MLPPVGALTLLQDPGYGFAQLESEPWRGTVGARLLLIDEIDRGRVRRGR